VNVDIVNWRRPIAIDERRFYIRTFPDFSGRVLLQILIQSREDCGDGTFYTLRDRINGVLDLRFYYVRSYLIEIGIAGHWLLPLLKLPKKLRRIWDERRKFCNSTFTRLKKQQGTAGVRRISRKSNPPYFADHRRISPR
jgi:hypothetical protein